MSSANSLFPLARIEELPPTLQGFCSYTLLATIDSSTNDVQGHVIQFRPAKYAVDMRLLEDARKVYRNYAPIIQFSAGCPLDGHGELQVSLASLVPGIPYKNIQPQVQVLSNTQLCRQKQLIGSFADFLARAWNTSQTCRGPLIGKIGKSLSERMDLLSKSLPSSELRACAGRSYRRLDLLRQLPVVLTHGDVLPCNVLVNRKSWTIEGLVDWAEAEYLPFGICLYGLEHFLGFVAASGDGFIYYSCANELRCHFWEELFKRLSVGVLNESVRSNIELARDVGVLLWYGFAWDDGAVNRAINTRDDGHEMMLLTTFLNAQVEPTASP